MLAFLTNMEHQSGDFDYEELRLALAARNTSSATQEEIKAARSAIFDGALPRWVNAAGNRQLKYWGRWAVGVGAITTIAMTALLFNLNTSTKLQYRTVVTNVGQRVTVQLPDGSTAQLAPHSQLRYENNFAKTRTVQLKGEGVFTITKTNQSPFTVVAGNTKVLVLGTTFGVRAYPGTAQRIIVAEGKVQVNNQYVLAIGDMLETKPNGKPIVTSSSNVSAVLGWTRGRLTYDSVSFTVMAEDLERWYGVRIRTNDKELAQRLVIAEFDNQRLEVVLQTLAQVLRAGYTRSGNEILFVK